MRKFLAPTLAAVVAAAITAGFAMSAGDPGAVDNRHFGYAIGLWGDVPYSDIQATVGVPNLMFYAVADTITVQRDRVVMKVDWMDSDRTIFLDGEMAASTPADVWAETGIKALDDALFSYCGHKHEEPFLDPLLTTAIAAITDLLPGSAGTPDPVLRQQVQTAVWITKSHQPRNVSSNMPMPITVLARSASARTLGSCAARSRDMRDLWPEICLFGSNEVSAKRKIGRKNGLPFHNWPSNRRMQTGHAAVFFAPAAPCRDPDVAFAIGGGATCWSDHDACAGMADTSG